MPIYEYECTDCLDRFEARQSFSEDALETCTKCSGKLRKVISTPAIHFKGTGWYVTDYADKKKNPGTAAPKKEEKPKTCAESCPAQAQCSSQEQA